MTLKKPQLSHKALTAIGIGAAATIAAGIAAYWLYGSENAARNRRLARNWILKAREEILSKMENAIDTAGQIDKDTYLTIVDTVLRSYSKMSGISAEELAQITRDMKKTWSRIKELHADEEDAAEDDETEETEPPISPKARRSRTTSRKKKPTNGTSTS